MTDSRRRRFLKSSAGLVSGLAMTRCAPERATPPLATAEGLDRSTLEAVARLVLPREALGDEGVSRVVEGFEAWLEGFEPVAEMNHPYLWTDEILYGPPDPGPSWRSQLEALELEAQKRHEARFESVSPEEQRAILDHQLPRGLDSDLPRTGEAPHVAVGLLAYFYNTSEASDLGYRAAIEKQTCRGLDSAPDEPAPLGSNRG